MKNFQFHVKPEHQDDVLHILKQTNDVVLDNVDQENEAITFTIQLDDDAADKLYTELKEAVDMRLATNSDYTKVHIL